MAFKVGEWNCVVAGAWNPAVLTPNGIRQHVLRTGPEVPIRVEVNIEAAEPPRVRSNDLLVLVGDDRLLVAPLAPGLEAFRKATEALRAAVQSLSQTPLRAAGVNFRYMSDDSAELWDERRTPLDERLEERSTVVARTFRRSLAREPGVINLEIREDTDGVLIEINFHRDSTSSEELSAWLDRVEEFNTEATALLSELGVTLEGQ